MPHVSKLVGVCRSALGWFLRRAAWAARALHAAALRFGFALLVLTALALSARIALCVSVPDPVPAFAIQAEPVYKLEVGAACFVGFYLAIASFVLALHNRGFIRFGTRAVEPGSLGKVDQEQMESAAEQAQALRQLGRGVSAIRVGVAGLKSTLAKHGKRLEVLEQDSKQ